MFHQDVRNFDQMTTLFVAQNGMRSTAQRTFTITEEEKSMVSDRMPDTMIPQGLLDIFFKNTYIFSALVENSI